LNNYSSLQVEIPEPYRERILNYAKGLIDDDDLVELERNPHITIKWGIETNRVEKVAEALTPFIPIRVMFGKTSFFPADDTNNKHDVLKIDVFGESLTRLRRKIESNVETVPDNKAFVPHITLGWVDRGVGLIYVGNNPIIGKKTVVDKVIFSPAYGDKSVISADGTVWKYNE
jgi:2'-5' RNA ligase